MYMLDTIWGAKDIEVKFLKGEKKKSLALKSLLDAMSYAMQVHNKLWQWQG